MRLTDLSDTSSMRRWINGSLAVLAVTALAACGGGENKAAATDTTATMAATPAAGSTATAAPATTASGTAMPITGKTVDVKMVGDAKGYRFEPANFTVKAGDGAQFINVSGGPHQVTFWADSIPAGQEAQLTANMPNTTAPLTGPLVVAPNQAYVVSFSGLKPGVYHYYCTPHLALGMRGVITVQ